MTKVAIRTLDSVTNNDTTATQLINENFQALQTAIENTLSRDGTTPNFMDANLDLNSYKIINAGTPTDNTDVITKEYFDEYVGDAAGYAEAAEQSANRAATSAQVAQGYSNAAAGAADVAQNARNFIESDPGFVAVSTDLLLGENSSIKKTSDDLANIDTVAGSIVNVNAVGTDIANVNAVADDLTNIDSVVTNMTDINNVATDLTKITAVADDLTKIDNVADDLTNIDSVADDLANIDAVANNATNIDTVANNETSINKVANKITEVDTVAWISGDVTTVAGNSTNINTVAGISSNVTTVANNISDVNTVVANITDIQNASANAQLAKDWANKTNDTVDGSEYSSKYYAEQAATQAGLAKQWAIGDPTEPVGNSSKYWAEYAESIAESIGDPANRDLSNLTDTGNNRFVNLQQQIDAIVASSDVFDIVANYAALQAYNITTVPVNDIIKVLVDETHSGAATYYRCVENGGVKSWSYIGAEGAYYTKGEADVLLAGRANTDLSNLSTTGQAVLDAKQDKATAVNYDNITNCITEIPQDIKLELDNGTLTLKAGSKVYVPNGSGGFEAVVTTNDKSQKPNYTANCLCFPVTSSGLANHARNLCFSGTTQPTSGQVWLNTNTMQFYVSPDNGVTWNLRNDYCLPIAETIATSGTGITSIDQVFNGFGYIGSTVFALPGVKGLIPNGRNEDGTLKNIESTLTRVHTYWLNPAWGTGNNGHKFYLRVFDEVQSNYAGDVQPDTRVIYYSKGIPSNTYTGVYYDIEENKWFFVSNGAISAQDIMFIGASFTANITASTSKVAGNFTPKTAFHAVDYNDSSTISGWSMPSSRYIDLTLGAGDATYTAPANGYVCVGGQCSGFLAIYNPNNGITSMLVPDRADYPYARAFLPVKKGHVFAVGYVNLTVDTFRFIYAEGEN